MSAMPSIYSDELTTALAAGKWWAMVEVSSPISEGPEYGSLISGQWGDIVEAQQTSCPTSLVFSDASEKAQRRSRHSGFSDATRKTTKQSRQKIAQGGPVPARSKQGAPVPANSEKGDLSSSMVFSDASEQAPNSSFSDAMLKNMEQRRRRRKKKPERAPVPDGSPHGTPVAAPKDSVGLCQALPQKLCVEIDNLTEKMQQLNFNLESHNHQAPQRRPKIRSSLRRGSQLSRKRASDNAGVDPKGVLVHSGTPQGAPIPDGSPHGTPVAAPKDNVGQCQGPPQKLCVETDNLNEKNQQLNINLESHNHQAPQRRPKIRSSLRRGSQLSRKRASDNAGVDPKGVLVHSGTPQGASVPDGSPHGTPVAAPKDSVGLCQGPPQKLCVEIDNLNEKMQQLNFDLESHNHQAPQRRPTIRSSLRRGSQLSRKRASDNAGVDPKGVPVHSGTPQGAPIPDGSPHGTPVAAPKENVGLCQGPPQKLCVETDNLNEKTQQLNINLESHNHQAPQRRPKIRSSLRRGSQLSRKRSSDNAGVDPKGVPAHSGTPQGAPVPDGSPHGTPVAAPKDSVGQCQGPPQKLCVEIDNLNEKTQQLNINLESHNHQAPQRRPKIRSSLRRGSQLSRKRSSDNAGVDPKGVPVHSGTPHVAPVPTGYPQQGAKHEIPLHLCNPLLLEMKQKPQASCPLAQRTQTRSQLTRKRALDNAGVDQSPPQKKQRMAIEVKVQQSEQGSLEPMEH